MAAKKRKSHNAISSPDAHPRSPSEFSRQEKRLSREAGEGASFGDWSFKLLVAMLILTPAVGVPFQEMLQDTLKSMVVSILTLSAAVLFFWQHRSHPLRWHAILWFPVVLMGYSLGSMAWSHTYLAGVEAIRWFVLGLLMWLGLNSFTRERFPALATGIHVGAVIASLWTALQFWINFAYFPQGPNPGSTFVNRNFFAEMAVCALPFSVFLLAQARRAGQLVWMAFSTAFIVVAVLMTGTRSALVTLTAMLVFIFPLVGFLYRKQFDFSHWNLRQQLLVVGLVLITVVGLGAIKTGNPTIASEQRGTNMLERGINRGTSVVTELSDSKEFATGSVSVRLVMWRATARMMADNLLTGVGAGAWEVEAPRYQNTGSHLETDYYAHNEPLQLLAEFGLVGLLALAGLIGYLLVATWLTLRCRSDGNEAEGGLRAVVLTSLLALLLVSNAGFPWRLASTAAIFAAALGALAASDSRLTGGGWAWSSLIRLRAGARKVAVVSSIFGLMLAIYISWLAAATEYKIISAVKLALMISQSGEPTHQRWNRHKNDMLVLVDEGTAINPHYRKITPMVADHLSQWGDWDNATWIWESVVRSRPHVVGLLANVARGYSNIGDHAKALEYMARAKKLQPEATLVRSLEVTVLARAGREPEASALAQGYLKEGVYDFNLVNAAISLGLRSKNFDMAIEALELRNRSWPAEQVEAQLELARIYAEHKKNDPKALEHYRAALGAASEQNKGTVRRRIPAAYLLRL